MRRNFLEQVLQEMQSFCEFGGLGGKGRCGANAFL